MKTFSRTSTPEEASRMPVSVTKDEGFIVRLPEWIGNHFDNSVIALFQPKLVVARVVDSVSVRRRHSAS